MVSIRLSSRMILSKQAAAFLDHGNARFMDLRFASAAGRAVAATGVDFPVQSLEDAGWEGRHDAPSALLRTMLTESLPD